VALASTASRLSPEFTRHSIGGPRTTAVHVDKVNNFSFGMKDDGGEGVGDFWTTEYAEYAKENLREMTKVPVETADLKQPQRAQRTQRGSGFSK